ncbi:hypothetical protein MPSI1_001167 [Malassezia psittaci]|uniref:Uncharacterized protein n=1 Tax=Malassezia psittaci TaxID=1821823 RepID=A0AAF0JD24_9BASI|nr:hypothetical protein MPSI1_001167 [Malassezia psittaci]
MTGGADQHVNLWNARTDGGDELDSKGRSIPIQRYSAHTYEVLAIDIAPDNSRFASGGPDRSALVWDVASGQVLRRLNVHTGRVNDLCFAGANDEGSILFVAGSDTVCRAYDLRTPSAWRPIMEVDQATDSILTMAMSNPTMLHTGSVDGVVRTYDIRKGELRSDVIDEPVTSLLPTKDGAALLVSTLDSTHRLIDMLDGTLLQTFKGHKHTSFRCHTTMSLDESLIIAGDENGNVHAWDTVSGRSKWQQHPDYSVSTRLRRNPNTPVTIS